MPADKPYSYNPVLPDIRQWPIVLLDQDRQAFLHEVRKRSMERLLKASNGSLHEEIARTLFMERQRLQEHPGESDSADETVYWDTIKEYLLRISVNEDNADKEREDAEIIADIIRHYTEEIAGRFRISAYRFAKRAFPFIFSRLMNAPLAIDKNIILPGEKIHLNGHLDQVRSLAKTATLVAVPTHFSNLDSIIVAWAIQTLGLPAFLYGAGYNLFGIRLFSYFMNRMGAYKVDRRKKSLAYLETLKSYSSLAIHRGCHSLFFPGGARSRSGGIENRLKLGLLGTAMEAQFMNLQHAPESKKVIIVPVVINYHYVPEAPFLIDQYLKQTGKEHYLIDETDRFSNSYEIIKMLIRYLTASTDFSVTFGECMDVFGNKIDSEGHSINHAGNIIDIQRYFISKGELKPDSQRDAEYVRMLSENIVRSYHKESTVYSSHLVAYAAFELIKKDFPRLDIYGLLRLAEEDRVVLYKELSATVQKLTGQLRKSAVLDKLRLAPHFGSADSFDADGLIDHGLKNLGVYHAKKVLKKNKRGNIVTEDMKLLYYYHNRLAGYGLDSGYSV